MPNFRAIKICRGTTRPGNVATITNLQIGLNTPKSPYLNQASQKILPKIFLPQKIPKSKISNKNSYVRDYVTRNSTDKYSLKCSILRVFKATLGFNEKKFPENPGKKYPEFQTIFFSYRYWSFAAKPRQRGAKRRERKIALSNRKHGLFHIRYFENGPLEPA